MQQLFRPMVGAFIAASFCSAAPALADSATDSVSPLRSATAPQPSYGSGDEQFHALYASWQALDPAPLQRVSIPSRTPLDGYRQTSGYGMRVHPVLGGRRAHKGIDLASSLGTPIYAAADGVVAKADWFGGYGLFVQLEHGGDMDTRYGHMSRLAVASGQRVRKGDLIGYVGSTGRSTGPHLHYEVRIAGEAVNPLPYMQTQGNPAAFAALDSTANGQGGPE
jgi:murein DD-endopeptidase MepM/ murein hydrolase activator NlpD